MNEKPVAIIGLIDKNGHLTPAALQALRSGSLCEDALTEALTHIGGCEKCAEVFASSFDDNELAQVPAGFDEELQKRLKASDKDKHAFAFYVFRVALAACIALIITFSSAFNSLVSQPDKISEVKAPGFSVVNAISTQLRDFSQNVVNWRF